MSLCFVGKMNCTHTKIHICLLQLLCKWLECHHWMPLLSTSSSQTVCIQTSWTYTYRCAGCSILRGWVFAGQTLSKEKKINYYKSKYCSTVNCRYYTCTLSKRISSCTVQEPHACRCCCLEDGYDLKPFYEHYKRSKKQRRACIISQNWLNWIRWIHSWPRARQIIHERAKSCMSWKGTWGWAAELHVCESMDA